MKHSTDLLQWKIKSPTGPLYFVASKKGLRGVSWNKFNSPMAKNLDGDDSISQILRQTADELTAYFQGSLQNFSVPLDQSGTPFQLRVWRELSKIPFGKTVAYKDIAKKINNSKAVRAVGSANGKNPIAIIVPCHRVIATGGGLGGYAGGLQLKSKLLRLEQSNIDTFELS